MKETSMTGNHRLPCQRTCKNAFTLVEVLVVIAVIAVLAGLILAAVVRSMETARATQCVGQLGQVGKGWLQVVHDSPIPNRVGQGGFNLPKIEDGGSTWVDTLDAHLGGDRALYRCPSQANVAPDAYGYGMNPLCGAGYGYTAPMFVYGFTLMPSETRPRPLNGIHEPAKTVVVCEAGRVTDATATEPASAWTEDAAAPWRSYVAFPINDSTSPRAQATAPLAFGYDWATTVFNETGTGTVATGLTWDGQVRAMGRHNGRCGSLFADAHVAPVGVEALTDAAWASDACLFDNERQ